MKDVQLISNKGYAKFNCNEIHFTYIILVNVKVLKYQDLMKM